MHMNRSSGVSKIEERRAKGADWRRRVPLSAQAEWKPPINRVDPVEVLIEQGRGRIPELLPERYKRMRPDAFAFLRGAAAIMAADLAAGPPRVCAYRPAAIVISPISAPMR